MAEREPRRAVAGDAPGPSDGVVVDVALLHPERLWALLGIPVLFWLALPPRPRRVVGTAHWGPWQRALLRAGHRPVRLRRLRFWLLAVAFVLAVCAWAGFRIGGRQGPGALEVVIDGSASMAVQEDGRSLLARARDEVAAVWDGLDREIDVAVVQVGEGVRVWRGRGGERPADWGVAPEPRGEGEDLAGFGGPAAAGDRGAQRWVLTDGARGAPVEGALTTWTAGRSNAALEAAGKGIEDEWPLPRLEVRVVAHHRSGGRLRGRIELEGALAEGAVPAPQEIVLEPGGHATVSWNVERSVEGGPLRARLAVDGDALPADDVLEWQLAPLPQPRLTVLTDREGGPWVVSAAELLADRTGGVVVEAQAGREVTFLLVDGGRLDLAAVPRGMVFGAVAAAGEGDGVGAPWIGPRVVDWDREHPLTAGLDFSELRVEVGWPTAVPPEAHVLVRGDRGPLIGVVESERGAFLHTAFRLGESNLWMLAAFPQLLQRSFAAGWGATRSVRPVAAWARVVPVAESILPDRTVEGRPLAPFGEAPWDPGPWLLAGAALLLALRVYA